MKNERERTFFFNGEKGKMGYWVFQGGVKTEKE